MKIDKNELKKRDDETRKEQLEELLEITEEFHVLRTHIDDLQRLMFGSPRYTIPVPSATMNNKIVELNNEYKRAGIFLFHKICYAAGICNGDLTPQIDDSLIGIVVILDLMEMVQESTTKIDRYYRMLSEAKDKNSGFFRSFYVVLRSIVTDENIGEIILSDEASRKLDELLISAINIDDRIFNYNLRDNIVPSIVKRMRSMKFDPMSAAFLVEDDIVPDLTALGLSDLVPELKDKLIKAYLEDVPDDVTQEKQQQYIPNFERAKQIREVLMTASERFTIESSNLTPNETSLRFVIISEDNTFQRTNLNEFKGFSPKIRQKKPSSRGFINSNIIK